MMPQADPNSSDSCCGIDSHGLTPSSSRISRGATFSSTKRSPASSASRSGPRRRNDSSSTRTDSAPCRSRSHVLATGKPQVFEGVATDSQGEPQRIGCRKASNRDNEVRSLGVSASLTSAGHRAARGTRESGTDQRRCFRSQEDDAVGQFDRRPVAQLQQHPGEYSGNVALLKATFRQILTRRDCRRLCSCHDGTGEISPAICVAFSRPATAESSEPSTSTSSSPTSSVCWGGRSRDDFTSRPTSTDAGMATRIRLSLEGVG